MSDVLPQDLAAVTTSDRFLVGSIIGRQKSFGSVEKLEIGFLTVKLMVGVCEKDLVRIL